MGLLALGILWVNTLLIVLSALKEAAALSARRRAMPLLPPGARGPGLLEGRVLRGAGRTGALAGRRVDQVGRAGSGDAGRETILFSDRKYDGEIYGGAVEVPGESGPPRALEVSPVMVAEVWMPPAAMREAAACPSASRFDEAYPHARKARGYSRTVEAMLRPGSPVWILGERTLGADPPEVVPTLIAGLDPRAWCRSKVLGLVAFSVAVLVVASGCTAVALVPPVFGGVSKLGGALCLGFFLLVQPAGTAMREAVRSPAQAVLQGRWERRELGGRAPADSVSPS